MIQKIRMIRMIELWLQRQATENNTSLANACRGEVVRHHYKFSVSVYGTALRFS